MLLNYLERKNKKDRKQSFQEDLGNSHSNSSAPPRSASDADTHKEAKSDGELPLHMAVRRKSLADVKKLIEKGESIEQVDQANQTPLHIAVFEKNLDLVKALLKNRKKQNVNVVDSRGMTPLLLAAEVSHAKICQELLKNGGDSKALTPKGNNILHLLLSAPKPDKSIVSVMKLVCNSSFASEINRKGEKGQTALQLACARGGGFYYDAAIVLLKAKADPNICSAGDPCLFGAVQADNAGLAKALLDRGADITQMNSKNMTILEIANPKSDVYRVIKKTAAAMPGGERKIRKAVEEEMVVANSVDQLPPDLLGLYTRAQLPADKVQEHWEVFCNVLYFVGKKRIVGSEEQAAAQRAKNKQHNVDQARAVPSQSVLKQAEQLITPGNPKKLYKKMAMAGKGGFGMVFSATSPDKERVAIKRMPHTSDRDKKSNLREVGFLQACTHPNIVKFFSAYDCSEEHEIWIVMELLEGGTLDEAVLHTSDWTEKHIAFVAREILQGLSYLHGRQIAHRDLKAANIMMSIEGEIKLIDFGLAIELSSGPKVEMCGSPYWMPPEMICKKPHSFPADIWSMAVCILELANKKPPNAESPVKCMFTAAVLHPPAIEKPDKWSETFKDFMGRCLVMDQTRRATTEELLKHQFLQKAAKLADMKVLLKEIFMSTSVKETVSFI